MLPSSIRNLSPLRLTLLAVFLLQLCSDVVAVRFLGFGGRPTEELLAFGGREINDSLDMYLSMLDYAEAMVRDGNWPNPDSAAGSNAIGCLRANTNVEKYSETLKQLAKELKWRRNPQARAMAKRAKRLSPEYKTELNQLAPGWRSIRLGPEEINEAIEWLYQQRANILTKAGVGPEEYSNKMRGHGDETVVPDKPNAPPRKGPLTGRVVRPQQGAASSSAPGPPAPRPIGPPPPRCDYDDEPYRAPPPSHRYRPATAPQMAPPHSMHPPYGFSPHMPPGPSIPQNLQNMGGHHRMPATRGYEDSMSSTWWNPFDTSTYGQVPPAPKPGMYYGHSQYDHTQHYDDHYIPVDEVEPGYRSPPHPNAPGVWDILSGRNGTLRR